MPLLRSSPTTSARVGRIASTSIRGKIFALLREPGVLSAVEAAPITVADLAASLPCPAGKSVEQWKKEIGSNLAVDLKKNGPLAQVLRRVEAGRFGPAEGAAAALALPAAEDAADDAAGEGDDE